MRVYVGGKYGETPTVVAGTIEAALALTVDRYVVATARDDERWTCLLLPGDPAGLRCTVTLTDQAGDTHSLYVQRFEVMEPDDVV